MPAGHPPRKRTDPFFCRPHVHRSRRRASGTIVLGDGREAIHADDSALGGLASGAVLSFGGQRHVSAVADVRASKRDAGCTRFGADVSAAQIDSAGEVHMSSGVASNDFHVSACGSEAISDVDGRDDGVPALAGGMPCIQGHWAGGGAISSWNPPHCRNPPCSRGSYAVNHRKKPNFWARLSSST